MKLKLSPLVSYLLLLLGVAWLAQRQSAPSSNPAQQSLLNELQAESDSTAPTSDYTYYPGPPTEMRRRDLIARFRAIGPAALPDIRSRLQQQDNSIEFSEMLTLVATALGDETTLISTAKLLAWSPSPAVRMSAVRVLRQRHDPRATEWLTAALNDERYVLTCGCGAPRERYYPVRTVAEITLQEMGVNLPAADWR